MNPASAAVVRAPGGRVPGPVVRLDRVSVCYYEHIALSDVSLEIPARAFAAIIGPNGAGKTTLLTVVNGLGDIRGGRVEVLDTVLDRRTVRGLRCRIGYVPQHLNVDPRAPINCREAVLLGRVGRAGLLRRLSAADRAAADRALELTGVSRLADRPVGHLSGGEARKVSLARVIAQEPEILLLDEPLSNLDPRAADELEALVVRLHRRLDLTTILVTHRVDRLPPAVTRVILLKDARVVFVGDRAAALAPDRVAALFA
ncbi:MAG TPA: ATP-binding cassette domain-containing protein [candidate division WOR-3 bacterium]|uniref:ATP-binding cassette domain-containing protein n=1 Tax=candidate division WOR-3 bacterium TaxID=2052148 RepID=A0A7V0T6Z0_UNCW3|nr:ATP-binding cassette domain-containing protein [candidate division WOR-3 bacterium]